MVYPATNQRRPMTGIGSVRNAPLKEWELRSSKLALFGTSSDGRGPSIKDTRKTFEIFHTPPLSLHFMQPTVSVLIVLINLQPLPPQRKHHL